MKAVSISQFLNKAQKISSNIFHHPLSVIKRRRWIVGTTRERERGRQRERGRLPSAAAWSRAFLRSAKDNPRYRGSSNYGAGDPDIICIHFGRLGRPTLSLPKIFPRVLGLSDLPKSGEKIMVLFFFCFRI